MSAHESLLVTARLSEPVVHFDDGMHLDGIVAWAAYRDLTEEQRWELPPINTAWAVDFPLPIARWSVEADIPPGVDDRLRDESGRVWGWMATRALAVWRKRSVFEVRKRIAGEQMTRYTDAVSVNAGCGPAKAYDLKLPTSFAHEVRWFCIGDKDELLRLLQTHVLGIGKHCAKGQGRVMRWAVEPADVSAEWVMSQRRMPCRESEAQSIASIRPPYHHVSRHTYARDPDLSEPVIHPVTGEVLAA